jgi:hypothetical protein
MLISVLLNKRQKYGTIALPPQPHGQAPSSPQRNSKVALVYPAHTRYQSLMGVDGESKADLYTAAGAGASAQDLARYGLDPAENFNMINDTESLAHSDVDTEVDGRRTDVVNAVTRDSDLSLNSWEVHPPVEIRQPEHHVHTV